jgi:hypothetical protein
LSPLNQVGGLIAALGGTSSGTGILNSLGVGGLNSIFNSISNAFSGGSSFNPSGSLGMDELMNQPTNDYTYTDNSGNTQTGTNDEFYYDR